MSCRPAFPIIELPSPFSCENGVVRLLEERGMSQEVLQRKLLQEEYDRPFVFDNGLTRSLYFSLRYVQSSMRTRDPIALEFAYTRKMMSFLLFQRQIRNDQSIHPAGIALFYKFFHAIMQYRVVIHHKYNRDLHTIGPHLFHTGKCFLQICPTENCLIGSCLNDRTVCHRI